MMNGLTSEEVSGAMGILRKTRDSQPNEDKVALTTKLRGAIAIADSAQMNLHSKFSIAQLKEMKDFLRGEYIFPDVYNRGPTEASAKEVDNERIVMGMRALGTYATISKYQEKVEDLRKVRRMDGILGDSQ